jgi:small subunit ribosomal protein S2
MRFVYFNKVKKLRKRYPHFVEFTLLQLLQHNIQLGAAVQFSLLSSHWFIYGVRQRFTIINLSQTITSFRYFLEIVRTIMKARRHALFVNERHYSTVVTRDVARSVGEAYIMGRWVGGSLTNFKRL